MKAKILFAIALLSAGAWADEWTDPDTGYTWTYYIDGDMAEIADILPSPTGAIAIPSVIDCTPVTSIGDSAFSGYSGLTSVTIPDSVTCIGDCAFDGCCGLTSVTIPDNVTSIGYGAFQYCSGLTSVTIGNGVTSIGNEAFCGCSELAGVTIGNSVISIGYGAFTDCSGLTSVTIPDSVTSIGDEAFYRCDVSLYNTNSIPGVVLVDGWAVDHTESLSGSLNLTGVRGIGPYAFCDCDGITSVTIPNSVKGIGADAFGGCNDSLYDTNSIPGVKLVDGWAVGYTESLSGSLDLTGVRGIGSYAFYDCDDITSVMIPDGVTSIEDSAFEGCGSLTNVTIPNSVTSIGDCAFYECEGLFKVVIYGNGLKRIGAYAFQECKSLDELIIPQNVVEIGDEAFCGIGVYHEGSSGKGWRYSDVIVMPRKFACDCSYSILDKFCLRVFGASPSDYYYYDGSKYKWGGRIEVENIEIVFDDIAVLQDADGNDLICRIEDGGANIVKVMIDDTVVSYVIPSSSCGCLITGIGDSVFEGCSSLTSVTMPDSVTSIGHYAFEDCRALETMVVPGSVTNIGCHAFIGCDALRRVVLPKWCKTVNVYYDGDEYCILSMSQLSLGRGRTRVGFVFHAFYDDDDSLEDPEIAYRQIEEGILSRIQIVYADVGGDTPISEIIKEEKTADGCTWTYALDGNAVHIIEVSPKDSLAGVVEIPATLGSLPVVGISAGVFRECAGIEGITIPDSVTEIGDGAFDGCGKLLTAWYRTLANSSVAGSGISGSGSPSVVTTVVQQVVTEVVTTVVQQVETPYALTNVAADRAIASVTVNSDCAIDAFVLKNGMVYDSMLRIVNTADHEVKLTLPTGYSYETFKGVKPLEIPAKSRSLLSITRVEEKTFLVSREDLEDVQ